METTMTLIPMPNFACFLTVVLLPRLQSFYRPDVTTDQKVV
jgi:hypothetical protein